MAIKRFRLTDKHKHMQKFYELCQKAEELGIQLNFGYNRSFVSIEEKEYEIRDIDDPNTPVQGFPPVLDYDLVYEEIEPEPLSELSQKLESEFNPKIHQFISIAFLKRFMEWERKDNKEIENLADKSVRENFLKKEYELIDDAGNMHTITCAQASKANRQGFMYHPETGERINKFVTYPMYRPGERLTTVPQTEETPSQDE